MEKWKCSVCGYMHEGPMTDDFKCPLCKQPAEAFVKVEEPAAKAPFAGSKTEKRLLEFRVHFAFHKENGSGAKGSSEERKQNADYYFHCICH